MSAAVRAMPQRKAAKPRWRRHDAHERQAEASASGFIAGRSQLQHGLTAAAAASYVVDGSAASMLPIGLAGQLESAFGADLSALRIHRDTPANAAASAFGARAFTSGTAIYFAHGAWNPSSESGRRLIGHEVAHAIQQTGRAAHGGLRLEPRATGQAGVQREEDINKRVAEAHDRYTDAVNTTELFADLKLLDPETGKDACLKVIERHLKSSAQTAIAERAKGLQQTLVGHDDNTVAAALDATFAAIPRDERSDEVKALFYDCFKAAGAGRRAIEIVDGNIPKQTAFGSWSFYEKYLRDGNRVVATLRSNKAVRRYVFDTVVAFARLDYYGLLRGPLDIDAQGKFRPNMRDAIEEALRYDPLMANERMVAALRALVRFEDVREAPFLFGEKELRKDSNAADRAGMKSRIVKSFMNPDFLASLATASNAEREVVEIARAAGVLLQPVAQQANDFWADSVRILQLVVGSKNADSTAQARSSYLAQILGSHLSKDKSLSGVRKGLVECLTMAARPEAGGLPRLATIMANRAVAARRLKNLTYGLDQLIVQRDATFARASTGKDGATIKPPKDEDVISQTALGTLLLYMIMLSDQLVDKEVLEPDLQHLRAEDEAAAVYFLTAKRFRMLAQIVGFNDLVAASFEIAAEWKHGYIGLLAPFEPEDVDISQFAADFPPGEVVGLPLSGGTLITAVTALYYGKLQEKLIETLEERFGNVTREHLYDPAKQEGLILNTAIKRANEKALLPRRFRVAEDRTILFLPERERSDILKLLKDENHPYWQDFVSMVPTDGAYFIPLHATSHAHGLIAWIVPGINKIAAMIAALPGVIHLKIAKGVEIGAPDAFPGGAYSWLEALGTIVSSKGSLQRQIDDALQQWATGALANLDKPLRRATNNMRRTLGPQIEQLLGEFNASVNSKGYFENPRIILRSMLEFAGAVRPLGKADQQRQVAALMLEIAPTLNDRLNGTGRLDIILPFYKPVLNAAKYALDPANAKTMTDLDLAFGQDQIASRAQTLKSLAEAFQKSAVAKRGDRVLHGDPASGRVFVPGRPYPLQVRKKDNDDDDADDMLRGTDYGQLRRPVMYQLVAVHKAFAFEPPLTERDGATGDVGNAKLLIEGKPAGPDPVDLLTIIVIENGEGRQIVVTSADIPTLSHLFYSLDMKITIAELQDLGDALEVFADAIVTAIQILFPEFAPEIAYAQMAGSIVQFFGGPEYQIVKSLLSGDIGDAFSKGYDELKKELSPEALWNYLLFQDVALPAGLEALKKVLGGIVDLSPSMGSVNRRKDPGTRSAIGKVFSGIAQFGSSILEAVTGVHKHVAPPVRKFELFVEGHPVLAVMLQFIAEHLAELTTMSIDELGVTAVDELSKPVDEMFARANAFLEKLGNFELPRELVPFGAIVLMVVNFIIDRLPAKYRVPLRKAEETGPGQELFQWIADKVAAKLSDAGIDPNILWRDMVKTRLDPIVHDAGKSIADAILELVTHVLPTGVKMNTLTVRGLAASFFDEAQPAVDNGRAMPTGRARLPLDEGSALPRADRARSERGMGHDFGHVRLHRGARVDSALRSSGARAATAGSHVFLDSGVNTGAADGRDTLSHELAHVLQQGGPRPLGERYSSSPRGPAAGTGGGRWRVDPGAERQADRLAVQAREPAGAPRPVTPHHGVQPKLTDFVARFFAKMGDAADLHEQAAKLGSTTVNEDRLKAAAPHLKSSLGSDLISAFKSDRLTVKDPFTVAQKDIVTFVTGAAEQEIRNGIEGVIMTAIADVKKKGAKKTAKKEDRTAPIVRADWLETRLEEFLFGVTGMSIDVELKRGKDEPGPDGIDYKTVDPAKPIKTLAVNYIHFPFLHGGTNLWQNLMDTAYPGLKGAERTKQASRVRLVLGGLQIDKNLFNGKGRALNLSDKAKNAIEAYRELIKGGEVPGDLAPRWSDYLDTAKDAQTTHGQIGLRAGTHGEMIKGGHKSGKERESHHTVQYLLVEYLNNLKSGYRPFPVQGSADPKKNLYPSIQFDPSGKGVNEIWSEPGTTNKIKVGIFIDGQRAAQMPTLLLSAFAHKKGRVHITPEADDESTDPPSQGQTVHNRFTKALGPYAPVVKSATMLKAIKEGTTTVGLPVGATPAKLATAIFNATLTTYESVRDDMNGKLAAALNREEKAYYRALVARATNPKIYNEGPQPGYEPTTSTASVIKKVTEDQTAVLGNKFGFKPSNKAGSP